MGGSARMQKYVSKVRMWLRERAHRILSAAVDTSITRSKSVFGRPVGICFGIGEPPLFLILCRERGRQTCCGRRN